MSENDILKILGSVTHPDSAKPVTIKNISTANGAVRFTIVLERARDPFANSLKREAARLVAEQFPETEGKITVFLEEPAPKAAQEKKAELKPAGGIEGIKRVIAVASGKGGVGKSTVTANIAVTMVAEGLKVGILDADIYGPSQPALFGVEGYQPDMEKVDGK